MSDTDVPMKGTTQTFEANEDTPVTVNVYPHTPEAPDCPTCGHQMSDVSDDLEYERGQLSHFQFKCLQGPSCLTPKSLLGWVGAGKAERATWPEWQLIKDALLLAEQHWGNLANARFWGREVGSVPTAKRYEEEFRELREQI